VANGNRTTALSGSQLKPPALPEVSDCRSVNGILMAFKTVTKVMSQKRIITMDNIEQNVSLPADIFALPADIKVLIK